MASRELIVLIDDLDGQEITQGGETVRFGLDGVAYEIDLSAEHATGLREALQPYTARGRRVGGRQHVVVLLHLILRFRQEDPCLSEPCLVRDRRIILLRDHGFQPFDGLGGFLQI